MLDDAYRSGHDRVAALAARLTDDDAHRAVPACPDWTVHDLLAHLAGTAADVAARRTTGMPGPAWTAAQVGARRGRGVAALLAEWDEHADAAARAVEDRRVPATVLQDLLAHEGDLVETLGAPPPPWEGWAGPARLMVRQIVKGIRGPDTLVVRSGGTEWRSPDDGGDGRRGPDAPRRPAGTRSVVTVDFYELYRGLQSRRSRDQMRRWHWEGPADPWVSSLPVHGPRDDEQPVPAPRM